MDGVDVITATPMGLTDKNLYAYCDNNPVMRVDSDGEFWLVSVLIGATLGAGFEIAGQLISGTQLNNLDILPVIISAISGGVQASPVLGTVGGVIIEGVKAFALARLENKNITQAIFDVATAVGFSIFSSQLSTSFKKLAGDELICKFSQTTKRNIKTTMLDLYPDTPGRNRNTIKDLYGEYVKEHCKDLGEKLLNKTRVYKYFVEYAPSVSMETRE